VSVLLYPACAIAALPLLGYGLAVLRRRPRTSTAILPAVTFGVFWDNLGRPPAAEGSSS